MSIHTRASNNYTHVDPMPHTSTDDILIAASTPAYTRTTTASFGDSGKNPSMMAVEPSNWASTTAWSTNTRNECTAGAVLLVTSGASTTVFPPDKPSKLCAEYKKFSQNF